MPTTADAWDPKSDLFTIKHVSCWVRVGRKVGAIFHFDSLRSEDLVTSSILPSQVLLGMRITFALYIFALLIYGWATDFTLFWSYYTNMNFTILCIYFVSVSCIGIYYHSSNKEAYKDEKNTTNFQKFTWVLFEFTTTNAFFLDIVFWTLLFTGSIDVYTVSAHALNSFFVLNELIFNNLQVFMAHFFFVLGFGILYLFFAWIYFAIGHYWIYSFLNWSRGWISAAYYIGVLLGGLVVFVVVFLLVLLRTKIYSKICSQRSVHAMGDEEMKEKKAVQQNA